MFSHNSTSKPRSNYYSFGSSLTTRGFSAGNGFRFGFNGKENFDKYQDYGFRIYYPELGKFLSVDPLSSKFPWYSPSQFSGNKPIESIDLDGLEELSTKDVLYRKWNGEPAIKKQSEWHFDNRYEDPDNLNKQFAKASYYNTQNNNSSLYKTVAERHAYYEWCQSYIDKNNIGGGSQWFGAAALVTKWNGLGGAEISDGGNFTSNATDQFLIGGNKFLFEKNMSNMKGLVNGSLSLDFIAADGQKKSAKDKTGRDLDYTLVEFEQTKVQEYITSYQKSNSKATMNTIFKEINRNLNYKISEVNDIIDSNFPKDNNGKSTFDFSNYQHRVILGKKTIDRIYDDKNKK